MGKYEKRRVFRGFRKAGVPFVLAQRLARASGVATLDKVLGEDYDYKVEECYCTCCGPTHLYVWARKDPTKKWTLDYWSLRPYV